MKLLQRIAYELNTVPTAVPLKWGRGGAEGGDRGRQRLTDTDRDGDRQRTRETNRKTQSFVLSSSLVSQT